MASTDLPTVVVVGAGIIGCAAARELAPDHDVVVIEKDQIAANASGRASGMITFSAQRSVLPEATRYSLDFFHEYEGSEQFEFTQRTGIELVPHGNEELARKRADEASAAGFPITFLDTETVYDQHPSVFDLSEYVGALKYGDTGFLDPYTLTTSLRTDAEEEGAKFEMGTCVTDLVVEEGAVSGVETDGGIVSADHVVIAAGWRTRELISKYVEIPVRPFRYQTVNIIPDDPITDDEYPIGWDPLTEFYWRPEPNGELHVGGGEYLVTEPGSIRETVNEDFRMKVATEIPERLQGFENARIASEDTCPSGDSATPDALPIIDTPEDAPSKVVVATGFHGYGIMEAPASGAAIRSLVTGEKPPFPIEPYTLSRFDDRSTDFGLVSLSEKREKHI